jgi:hypothetical protein
VRRRNEKPKKAKRKQKPDPDWFDPEIKEPDLPTISKIIIRKVKEPNFNPQIEYCDPRDELAEIELKMDKIRYAVALGRFKISKKHSIKEYVV